MSAHDAASLYVLACRQARVWAAVGEDALAARLRLAARKYMRKARWLKSIEID